MALSPVILSCLTERGSAYGGGLGTQPRCFVSLMAGELYGAPVIRSEFGRTTDMDGREKTS